MIASNGAIVETSPSMLMDLSSVIELQKILAACNKLSQEQQIAILVEQMREMEKNLSAVMQELSAVKEQLNDLSADNAQKGTLTKMAETADAKLSEQSAHLKAAGKDLNEKARGLVQKFKDFGITALNHVCEILGIKERLIVMRDNARSNAQSALESAEKIAKIEQELGLAKLHKKNAVKTALGKEPAEVSEIKENKILKSLRSIYNRLYEKYSRRVEKLDKAISRFDNLEHKAQDIKKAKKSLTEKLADNVKLVEARQNERAQLPMLDDHSQNKAQDTQLHDNR